MNYPERRCDVWSVIPDSIRNPVFFDMSWIFRSSRTMKKCELIKAPLIAVLVVLLAIDGEKFIYK